MNHEQSIPLPSKTGTNQGVILFTNCLTLIFLTIIFSAINVALPAINREFQADAILLGWVNTAGLLTSAILLLPFGRLSDIVGIKRMYGYGMILYTLTSVASALSSTILMLVIVRAVQGISIAMVVGNATAIISAIFPGGERGRALGITSASVYFGLAVGPLIGGLLTEHFGWRSIFIINIPMGIIAVLMIFSKIKGEWRGGQGEKLDVVGSLIFMGAFTALMYGFSILPNLTGGLLILAGIMGLTIFIFWENRTPSPIVNLNLFRRNKTFVFSNIAALINYSATFASVFLLSLYLQYIKGLSAEGAGLVLFAQPAIQACLSPFAGRLSDRIDSRIVSSAGMALVFVGLTLLAFLTRDISISQVIGVLLLMGIGLALFVSPNTNAVMGSVPPRVYGVASATINTMRQIGQMLSMGIVMVVLSVIVGRVAISEPYFADFVTSTQIAFAVFAALSLAGIFASFSRGSVRPAEL